MTELKTRIKQGALVMACCLLLASCASQQGIHANGRMAAPENYSSTQTLSGARQADWPTLDWARALGGDPLMALVNEALRDNPSLQAAQARVTAARALSESARAATLPNVSGQASVTRQRFTENGLFPPPIAGSYVTDSGVQLNLNYDFDFWGKHEAALKSALAQGQVAEAEQHSTRLVLASAVARGWMQLARQNAQVELIDRQIAARQKLDQLTRLRFQAGLDARNDTEQARQQISMLRVEQAQWQEAMALTRNQLAALLGQGPDRGLSIQPGKLPELEQLLLPAQLPSGLLGRRPDVVAARWRVEAAQGEIDNARAQFYPSVNLAAFAGFSAFGLDNLFNSGSRIVGVGPAIRLPIFEGGALRAQLKGRAGNYDAAVATYNQALTDALHEVADQVQGLRGAQTQAQQMQQAAEAAEQAWKLAQAREKKGTSNMLPVLAAELNLLSQQRLELDLQARRADLQVGLVKALGGGFDAQALGLAAASLDAPAMAKNTN